MKKTFSALALLCLSFATYAESGYLIQTTIKVAGEVRASPGLAVTDNKIGRISIDDGLDLALVAKHMGQDQVLLSSLLVVDGEPLQPSLLLKLGKRSMLRIGDTEITFLVENQQATADR